MLKQHMEGDTIIFAEGDVTVLWIKEELKEKDVVVTLGGELRSETIHTFQDEMLALASVGMQIILDFNEVSYISSSYMKALIKVELTVEKQGKQILIKNLSGPVRTVFEQTGAIDLLMIEGE